ncbi:MAG: superoxide dismutase, partial [Clostridiales bacterium]|nr:superoxide dismutase [Clostridiales bacterium]
MFEQVKLRYNFKDLEPYIDELTMITHYSKHHAAYTKNFNDAVEKAGLAGITAEEILASLDQVQDPALRIQLQNNGGGYYNHNLYFSIMSPNPQKTPEGELKEKIDATFGSFEALKEQLTQAASTRFGSGWAWLSADSQGNLQVSSTPNQDNPITQSQGKWTPILGIDVWEHAYYLKYKNLRGDYIKEFFNVLDWDEVGKLYNKIVNSD